MVKLVLFSGLLLGSLAEARASGGCQDYRRYFWSLDLVSKKIQRIGVETEITPLCGTLPKSGAENFVLETTVRDGKTVFQKELFILTERYFDRLEVGTHGKVLHGGSVAETLTYFDILLPASLDARAARIQIKNLERRGWVAEGDL